MLPASKRSTPAPLFRLRSFLPLGLVGLLFGRFLQAVEPVGKLLDLLFQRLRSLLDGRQPLHERGRRLFGVLGAADRLDRRRGGLAHALRTGAAANPLQVGDRARVAEGTQGERGGLLGGAVGVVEPGRQSRPRAVAQAIMAAEPAQELYAPVAKLVGRAGLRQL